MGTVSKLEFLKLGSLDDIAHLTRNDAVKAIVSFEPDILILRYTKMSWHWFAETPSMQQVPFFVTCTKHQTTTKSDVSLATLAEQVLLCLSSKRHCGLKMQVRTIGH